MTAPLLRYTVLRLALFVGSLGLLYLVGVRESILMLLLAAVISMALSYLLLGRQRAEVATVVSRRIEARLDRRAQAGPGIDEAHEDAVDDAARAGRSTPGDPDASAH